MNAASSSVDGLCFTSATDLVAAIERHEVSSTQIVEALFDRIERVNPAINAFVTLLRDEAHAQAATADRDRERHGSVKLGRLHGVPITVKDLTSTAGVRTTYGSIHFANNIPSEDTLAWARVKAEGAILVGKTTTPEFGWLAITESPLTGVTNNPWDLERTCGGSSGGAATAIAAGLAPLAMGSDGAGSIRIPASFCGVFGYKASAGRVPLSGEDEIYSTTEAVGPITRTVADAALMLEIMAGPDEREPFSLAHPGKLLTDVPTLLNNIKMAFSPTLGGVTVDAEVAAAVASAVRTLDRELGAGVDEIEVDLLDPLQHLLDFWAPATAVFLDDLSTQRGFDLALSHPVILALAEKGRATPGTALWRATVLERGRMHQQLARVFSRYHVLLTPSMPITAFEHPGPSGGPEIVAGRRVKHPFIGFVPFTAPFNMTGHPAATVPCGFDKAGLPIGLQIVGRHGADDLVLALAAQLERVAPWAKAVPPIVKKSKMK